MAISLARVRFVKRRSLEPIMDFYLCLRQNTKCFTRTLDTSAFVMSAIPSRAIDPTDSTYDELNTSI